MKDILDFGYPLIVVLIAGGLGVLGYYATHVSERMVRKSVDARGSLSGTQPSPDRPLTQALEVVRAAPRG